MRAAAVAAVALLLVGFVARADESLRQKSAVWDEFLHMDYGLNFLRVGPVIPPSDHPYPAAALPSLPLAISTLEHPEQIERVVPMKGSDAHAEIRAVEHPSNLIPARRANVGWALAAIVLLALGAGALGGWKLGLAVAALGSLDPGWIAQARFLTTDVLHGLGWGLASIGFARHATDAGLRWLALAGTGTALAFFSKFSGLMIPALAPLIYVAVPVGRGGSAPPWTRRLLRGAGAAAIAAGIALAWVLVVFEGRGVFGSHSLGAGLSHLADGFGQFLERTTRARGTFLLGDFHPDGTALYFPALIAAKTPLTLLALCAVGLALPAGRRALAATRGLLVLPAGFLFVAVLSGINLGHRHLTPVLPAIWLAAGCGLVALAELRLRVPATLAAVALLGAEVLAAHPHYLAYGNAVFGGVSGAHRVAVDSATDWGQDLPALAAWSRARPKGSAPLHLAYFGSADPRRYGVDAVWRPCGALGGRRRGGPAAPCHAPAPVLALSATCLQGAVGWDDRDECYARLREREPDAILGGSILIFHDVPAASHAVSP